MSVRAPQESRGSPRGRNCICGRWKPTSENRGRLSDFAADRGRSWCRFREGVAPGCTRPRQCFLRFASILPPRTNG